MFKKSKKLLSGVISVAILMSMFTGFTVFAVEAKVINVNSVESFQAAISSATTGDTIIVAAGTYSAGEFDVLSGRDGITIQGADINSTIFNLTAVSDGFKVQANNVTLKNFTINTEGDTKAIYGLRAQGVDKLTVQNVKITNMKKSGFDLNGITNSNLTGLVAQNNGGYGIAINQCKDVFLAGTTANNVWGAVDVANKPQTYLNTETAGINIVNVASSESLRLNVENYITGTDITSGITFDSTYMKAPIFSGTEGVSSYLATNIITVNPSLPANLVSRNYTTITDAISAAKTGDTIYVTAGTYDAPLRIIDKNLTIQGVAGTIITSLVSPAAVSTPSYGKNPIIFASGSTVSLKNITVKAGNVPLNGAIDGITAMDSNITLDNVTVTDILNAGGYNGMQYGRGLTVVSSASGRSTATVMNSKFDKFNKNGIHLIGTVTANISDTTFSAAYKFAGAVAQNGVVFMDKAIGSVTGCTFNNLWYTDDTNSSTGVLAYSAGAGIKVNKNIFTNTQTAVYNSDSPMVDATNNYWGSAAPNFAKLISGTVTHDQWYTDAALTNIDTAPTQVISTSGVTNIIGNSNAGDTIQVNLTAPNDVSTDIFKAAKDNETDVVFNVLGTDNKSLYSWSFAGAAITNTGITLPLGLDLVTPDKINVDSALPTGANPVYLHFEYEGNLPGPATMKVHVANDIYKAGDKVTIYYYNKTTKLMEAVAGAKDLIIDADGYVTFTITHCSDYVLTAASTVVAITAPVDVSIPDSNEVPLGGSLANGNSELGGTPSSGNPDTGNNSTSLPIVVALFSIMTMLALSVRKVVYKLRKNTK